METPPNYVKRFISPKSRARKFHLLDLPDEWGLEAGRVKTFEICIFLFIPYHKQKE